MVNKLWQVIRTDYNGEKFEHRMVSEYYSRTAAVFSADIFTSTEKRYEVVGKGGETTLWPKFTVM